MNGPVLHVRLTMDPHILSTQVSQESAELPSLKGVGQCRAQVDTHVRHAHRPVQIRPQICKPSSLEEMTSELRMKGELLLLRLMLLHRPVHHQAARGELLATAVLPDPS